jgi:hypothetical protein
MISYLPGFFLSINTPQRIVKTMNIPPYAA